MHKYQVLLYYKYIDIPDPVKLRDQQRSLCEDLELKGRIIVAKEGINGTVEGTIENTEKYFNELRRLKEFKDISIKRSAGIGRAFPKLSVKVRPEIVAAKMPNINPSKVSGKYLSAEELHKWFEEAREFYIVDMRNDYEQLSGYFEGSILPGIHNFYDLPEALPKLEHLKEKTVVTVCTGGVRCEKASGFLVQNNFKDVYQLKDGIQTYMEKYPNKHYKGKLYVFDNRLTLGFNINSPEHEIVGRCMHCNKPSDSYVNCAYDICHLHYICCEDCLDKNLNLAFCQKNCRENYLKYQINRSSKVPPETLDLYIA